MNNINRAFLYLVMIQTGFVLTQFFSSFGGFIEYLGLYLFMPLLITELHYRYMLKAKVDLTKSLVTTTRLLLFWGIAGAVMFVIFANLFTFTEIGKLLVPVGFGVVLIKQIAVLTISSATSLLMYRRISKLLAHANITDRDLVTG
jgi:hypothetical protein